MYLPYLKGKQNEFLALRELVDHLTAEQRHNVMPIIEPVRRSCRDAITAFKSMMDVDWHFALILNPRVGEFERGDNDFFSLVKADLEGHNNKWYPAFILNKNDNIRERIRTNGFDNIMLILPKLEDADYWVDLISEPFVQFVVICDGDSMPLLRRIKRIQNKTIIRMDESFIAEQKNAIYAKNIDHRFTDKHTYYKELGYWGFGDYTTLPSAFISGGVSPTVVAIHLTYNKNCDEIWIHHFLSNAEAKSNENVQGKFFEEASFIEPFFDNLPEDKTYAIESLIKFVKENHYPGLGAIKKWSIIHHVVLMSKY